MVGQPFAVGVGLGDLAVGDVVGQPGAGFKGGSGGGAQEQ